MANQAWEALGPDKQRKILEHLEALAGKGGVHNLRQKILDKYGLDEDNLPTVVQSVGPQGSDSPQVEAPPGATDIIEAGDQTIISGLPLFNQALRNLFANIFTGTVADAAQGQMGQGGFFDALLGSALQGLPEAASPQYSTVGGGTTPISPNDPTSGGQGTGGGPGDPPPIQIGNPGMPTFSGPSNDLGDLSTEQLAPDLGRAVPLIREMFGLGGGGRATGGAGAAVPQVSTDPAGFDPVERIFSRLTAGTGPQAGGSVALGTIATGLGALSSALGIGRSLFGGDDDPTIPRREANPGGQPYEPTFNTQNSLQHFLQMLQLFGPGGIRSRGGDIGASPLQGSIGPNDPRLVSTDPSGSAPSTSLFDDFQQGPIYGVDMGTEQTTQMGGTGAGGDSRLTNIVNAFDLPSFGGSTFAEATPLQRQATDFASEFLRSNPFGDTQREQQALDELVTTGARFDLSPEYQAIEQANQLRLQEESARLNELFGNAGLRFGTDIARAQAGLSRDVLADTALRQAQIGRESFESAQGRRLQALPLGQQLAQLGLGTASQAFQLGEGERQARERSIDRQMAEFARTQGALFPLLLQFALAGTEGDTVVLEPQ